MRTLGILLVLGQALAADVVVLKDGGEKVVGRVAAKESHIEVTTDQGLRTFLKEEVERVITDPKEFLGDADQLFEQAKQEYQKAVAAPAAEQNAILKDAIAKITKAREAYATTRDYFPEDKHASLDKTLMQIMQLMRLLRERVGSEIARGPAPAPRPPPPLPPQPTPAAERPKGPFGLAEALATLADPAKRADASARRAARELFLAQRGSQPDFYDVATAGALFLSRTDADWRLTGAPLAGVQEYFAKPWLKEPAKLTGAAHLEAAAFLADRVASVRKADAAASVEALTLFGAGHLSHAPAGSDREKAARALGFAVANGVAGTPEGLAVRDLQGWIAAGDFDLAVRAFVYEHRAVDTAPVRYVWSWALLRLVLEKRKGFERPVSGLASVKGDPAVAEHVAALSRSIQAAAPCSMCLGDGWLRCTNCHGQKVIYIICKVCNGTRIKGGGFFCNPCKFTGIAAKIVCNKCKDGYFDCPRCKLPACAACASSGRTACPTCKGLRVIKNVCGVCNGSGLKAGFGGGGGGGDPFCGNCKGSGNERIVKCSNCAGGFLDCQKCEPLRKPPAVEDICRLAGCAACEGRGSVFRGVAWACRSCLGLGLKLVPKAEPSKLLPD
jgi:hypothetical protein